MGTFERFWSFNGDIVGGIKGVVVEQGFFYDWNNILNTVLQ